MKTFIFEGKEITNEGELYKVVEKELTSCLDWKIGRNLDAFNDVLCGGFGVHDYREPIKIIWKNYEYSKQHLGLELTLRILEIMLGNPEEYHHNVKVELYD
ncbi:MAG: barstar family protein [Erysipelotrichales bacterium]